MRRLLSSVLCLSLLVPFVNTLLATFIPTVSAQTVGAQKSVDAQNGIQQLKNATGGAALISTNRATGVARFVRMSSGKMSETSFAGPTGTAAQKSATFFNNYGSAFGIKNPATELKMAREVNETEGGQHLVYKQVYNSVPVFAGELHTHFDRAGNLYAINGIFVPDIAVNTVPTFTAERVAQAAIANVVNNDQSAEKSASVSGKLFVKNSTLYIFREGLIKVFPARIISSGKSK